MTQQIHALHALWCKLTGQSPEEIRYATCERLLFEYVHSGFTEDNLLHVLTFIMHQNQKASHPRYRTRLLFHRIMDLETFASILGEAGPWYRNRKQKPTAKSLTVAAFRGEAPQVEQSGSTRSVKEIFKSLQQ